MATEMKADGYNDILVEVWPTVEKRRAVHHIIGPRREAPGEPITVQGVLEASTSRFDLRIKNGSKTQPHSGALQYTVMVDGISLGDGIIRTKSCARTEFRFLHQLDGIPVESDLYFARFSDLGQSKSDYTTALKDEVTRPEHGRIVVKITRGQLELLPVPERRVLPEVEGFLANPRLPATQEPLTEIYVRAGTSLPANKNDMMLQHRFIPILEDTSKPWLVFTFNYGLSQTLRQHGLLQVYTAPKETGLVDANGTISEHVKDINELRTQVSEREQRWTASRQSSIPLSARSHKAVDNLEVAFE